MYNLIMLHIELLYQGKNCIYDSNFPNIFPSSENAALDKCVSYNLRVFQSCKDIIDRDGPDIW